MADADKTPDKLHAEWVDHKVKAGWKHGPVKRPEALEHPCIVPWAELSEEQKVKDVLFLSIVNAVSGSSARVLTIEMPEKTVAVTAKKSRRE